MKQHSNYNKFLLLWSGELISAIGSGLTSFGLGVYVFQKPVRHLISLIDDQGLKNHFA